MHALYIPIAMFFMAAALVLGYGLFKKFQVTAPAAVWCKNVFRAGSKLTAAVFTGDDRFTFSAQCGRRRRDSFAWDIAAGVIDAFLGDGHCINAARGEGLL